MPLVGSVHRWELDRVANEKDRLGTRARINEEHYLDNNRAYCVVENPIKVSLVCVELH